MTKIRQSKRLIPWVVGLALFLEMLDSTIITTAIPKIAADLQVNPLDLKLALTSYLLSLAVFLPISSWAAEKYGTRTVFVNAMAVFTLGSICCGLAFNLFSFILARILQGMGGALMTPVARMVLVRVFSKQELLKVTSYMVIPALIGPMLGPVVGGIITTFLSWRWIFFINIPFAIYGLYFSRRYFFNIKGRHSLRLDKLGFVLFALASAGFTFSFETLGESYLPSAIKYFIWGMALLGLVVFSVRAACYKQTLFDLSLFTIPTFRLAFLGNICTRLALGGMNFILPLLFQLGLGLTPLQAGLLMAPLAAGLLSMKFFVKPILQRLGFRRALLLTTITNSTSLCSLMLIDQATPLFITSLLIFLQGFISSLQYSSMNALVLAEVPAKKTSQASMLLSTSQQLGSSFGVGTTALLLSTFINQQPITSVTAYHQTFGILAIILLLAAAAFGQLSETAGQQVSGHQRGGNSHSTR